MNVEKNLRNILHILIFVFTVFRSEINLGATQKILNQTLFQAIDH